MNNQLIYADKIFKRSKFLKKSKRLYPSWTWCYMPAIPEIGRLRQEDCEFKNSLRPVSSKRKEKDCIPILVLKKWLS
jgi:hypothetical protein